MNQNNELLIIAMVHICHARLIDFPHFAICIFSFAWSRMSRHSKIIDEKTNVANKCAISMDFILCRQFSKIDTKSAHFS